VSHDRLSELSVFVRVVDCGSFSSASRQLDLSASAVSKSISRMEERLGVRLLNRTSRSLQLTYEGEVVVVGARRVLAAMDEVHLHLAKLTEDLSGRLRIYTVPGLGYTLAPIFSDFVRKFPRMKFDIQLGAERIDLVEGNFDLAIRLGELRDSAYFARKIGMTRHIICASPHYLEKHGTPVRSQDLQNHNCLNFSIRTHEFIWGIQPEELPKHLELHGDIASNHAEMLRRLCLEGLGIVELPLYLAHNDIRNGLLTALLENITKDRLDPVWAIYPHSPMPNSRTATFIEFLRERIAVAPGFWPST